MSNYKFLNVKALVGAFSLLSECEIFANFHFQLYTTSMMQIVDTLRGRHITCRVLSVKHSVIALLEFRSELWCNWITFCRFRCLWGIKLFLRRIVRTIEYSVHTCSSCACLQWRKILNLIATKIWALLFFCVCEGEDKYFPHCRQKLKLTILNDNIIIHFITMDPRPRLSSLPLLKFILQSRWFEKCYKIDSAPFLAWSLGDRGRGLESCAALCWSECAVMARQVFTEWLVPHLTLPTPALALNIFYHSKNIFGRAVIFFYYAW